MPGCQQDGCNRHHSALRHLHLVLKMVEGQSWECVRSVDDLLDIFVPLGVMLNPTLWMVVFYER